MKKANCAIIFIFAVCLALVGCSREAPPIQVAYNTASPAPQVSVQNLFVKLSPAPDTNADQLSGVNPAQTDLLPTDSPLSEANPSQGTNTSEPMKTPEANSSSDESTNEASPTPPPLSKVKVLFQCEKDIDGDGSNEDIYVASSSNSDFDDFFIYIKDGSLINGTFIDSMDSYGIAFYTKTKDGISCLIVSLEGEDEDTHSYIYSLNASTAVLADDLGGYVSEVKGLEVKVDDWGDALRSWSFYQMFKLQNNCSLSAVSDMIITLDDGDKPLHTIKKLPVEMYVDGAYKPSFIKAGTDIYPVSTDCKSYLKFKLKDGSQGRIDYTFDGDDNFLINGEDEGEYFKYLDFWN